MFVVLALAFSLASIQASNPAADPVPQKGFEDRHREKVARVNKEKFDLLMIGDSITHNFEKPEYEGVWRQYFKPRHALNLGYSGARTENILWNLQHGELTGQAPKVVTLLIGTNNADETNYPTHHTPEQIAGGIEAILKVIRTNLPHTKILLLAPFPYGHLPAADSRGIVLAKTAQIIKGFADDKTIFFLDIGKVFLKPNGSMNPLLMPDNLHPNPSGALVWARAMEPLMCKLMGDESHDFP